MSNITNLLPAAAEIRDAYTEGENTASRIGSFLSNLLQALEARLPDGIIDGVTMGTSGLNDSVSITFNYRAADGSLSHKSVVIPTATELSSGAMSSSHVRTLTETELLAANAVPKSAIKQIRGSSSTAVMSQAAVSNALQELDADKIGTENVVQDVGSSTSKVMSQYAVTKELSDVESSVRRLGNAFSELRGHDVQAAICKGIIRVSSMRGNVYRNSTGMIIVGKMMHELDEYGNRVNHDDEIFKFKTTELRDCLLIRPNAVLEGKFFGIPLLDNETRDFIELNVVNRANGFIYFEVNETLMGGYTLLYQFDDTKNPFAEGNGYCMLSSSGKLVTSKAPFNKLKRTLTPPSAEEVYRTLYWGDNPPGPYSNKLPLTMRNSIQIQRQKMRTHRRTLVDGVHRWLKLVHPYKQWMWVRDFRSMFRSRSRDENVKIRVRRKTRTGVSEWVYFILRGNPRELLSVRCATEDGAVSTKKAYPGDPGKIPTWGQGMRP